MKTSENDGFTLIELLVVVLVVGVPAPQYRLAVEKTRVAQVLIGMRSIKRAMDMYKLENGVYCADLDDIGVSLPYARREVQSTSAPDGYKNEVIRYYGTPLGDIGLSSVYGYVYYSNGSKNYYIDWNSSQNVVCYAFIYEGSKDTLGDKLCASLGSLRQETDNRRIYLVRF